MTAGTVTFAVLVAVLRVVDARTVFVRACVAEAATPAKIAASPAATAKAPWVTRRTRRVAASRFRAAAAGSGERVICPNVTRRK